jgi:hypothetical protein
MEDPIVKEIWNFRKTHEAQFDFDLHAICVDLRKKEKEYNLNTKKLPAKFVFKKTGT